jgi:hypothetical protein
LASLLDTIKAAGNRNAHIATSGAARGMRWLPLWATVDEEAEKMVLKLIQPPLSERSYTELLERFNANVPYNGLAHITAPTVTSCILLFYTHLLIELHRGFSERIKTSK